MRHNDSLAPILDHGGGLDAAIERWGGTRQTWVDLSTGINPLPYPLPHFAPEDWTALPDTAAQQALIDAARAFWNVPAEADILAAPGASCLIAAMPRIFDGTCVHIPAPTYNEHAAAFRAQSWELNDTGPADACVIVHPNNPTGQVWTTADADVPQIVIDESFCDVCPQDTLIARATKPGGVVLKSFGKFWGLAGLRLGFAIALPDTIQKLRSAIGPWAVSGPALRVGARALNDTDWATQTRNRLSDDAARLDTLMATYGAPLCGGTALFRLYDTQDAQAVQEHLARHHIWSRIFPYSKRWIRLGLPPTKAWPRLEKALAR